MAIIKTVNWKRNNKSQEQIMFEIERYCNALNCIYKNLVITDDVITFTAYSKITYEELVNKLVREKYTDSDEFAILRKAINSITDEYLIYNAYVEECKVRAKAFVEERESVVNG